MFLLRSFLLALLVFVSQTSLAKSTTMTFEQPWIRMLPPTSMHTAAYVNIVNTSGKPDTLVDIRSNMAETLMLHQSVSEEGMMKMHHADNLVIPANGSVSLAPGGYHVMIMGLHQPLVENAKKTITFVFEQAGEVEVEFSVVRK